MQTDEQLANVERVKGARVVFRDCWTRKWRQGVVLDYLAPLTWKIQPDHGKVTYACDSETRTLDGRWLNELV